MPDTEPGRSWGFQTSLNFLDQPPLLTSTLIFYQWCSICAPGSSRGTPRRTWSARYTRVGARCPNNYEITRCSSACTLKTIFSHRNSRSTDYEALHRGYTARFDRNFFHHAIFAVASYFNPRWVDRCRRSIRAPPCGMSTAEQRKSFPPQRHPLVDKSRACCPAPHRRIQQGRPGTLHRRE